MTESNIKPEKVTSPIQLLAVWFVALIAIDSMFLTAARLIDSTPWLPNVLVIAAVINVPIFLICMFILQTRFRPEMQADQHYAKYLKEKQKTQELAATIRERMDQSGLGLIEVAQGHATSAVVEQVRAVVAELNASVQSLRTDSKTDGKVDPDSLRALAKGELALSNWLAAADILNEYAKYRPDDFDANFSRGVAFANARDGGRTDASALRAYNDAVACLPASLDADRRARLFTYRGAMLKRLNRFDEALADFGIAEKFASSAYEVNDLMYNVISAYALMGDRERMMSAICKVSAGSAVLARIRDRLGDYFVRFAHDEEFLKAIDR